MRRALILLKPYGREADRHKLKNGLKTPKMHFLPVFELTSARCPIKQTTGQSTGRIYEYTISKSSFTGEGTN